MASSDQVLTVRWWPVVIKCWLLMMVSSDQVLTVRWWPAVIKCWLLMMASSDQVLTVIQWWPVVIKCWLSDDGHCRYGISVDCMSDDGQQWSSVDCQMMASSDQVNDGQQWSSVDCQMMASSDQVLTVRWWPVVIKCWLWTSNDGQQWSSVDCQMTVNWPAWPVVIKCWLSVLVIKCYSGDGQWSVLTDQVIKCWLSDDGQQWLTVNNGQQYQVLTVHE